MMQVQHDPGRFLMEVNGKHAVLDYTLGDKKMNIFHTFTDPELRGKGLAEQLALAAFEFAKKNGYKIVPTCEYIRNTFLRKHSEFENLVEHW